MYCTVLNCTVLPNRYLVLQDVGEYGHSLLHHSHTLPCEAPADVGGCGHCHALDASGEEVKVGEHLRSVHQIR